MRQQGKKLEETIIPGKTYKLEGYYSHESGDNQYLIISWYDANDNWISQDGVAAPQNTSWTYVSVMGTAPSNAAKMQAFIGPPNKNPNSWRRSVGYWDDIKAYLVD